MASMIAFDAGGDYLPGGGAPEQDCPNALPVCQDTYVQPSAYSGIGDVQEVPIGSCLGSREKNSVWYIFTVQTAGTLEFVIDPNENSDDYDFALYNLTGRNCSDIVTGAAPEVRCNYCVTPGNTGISPAGQNPSEPCCNYTDCQFSTDLDVQVGQTFALTVSNFTSSNSGYTLTFGGTAEIFDETPPSPASVITPCGVNFINLDMSEPILCSSISANGSEFVLTGPGGPFVVSGATGENCGSATAQLTLNISPAVTIGQTYTLTVNNGNDGNTLIDNCGNLMPVGTSLTFVAVPNEAEITGPSEACAGSPVTLTASAGLEYEWSTGETTQTITVSPTVETIYSVTVTSGTCVQTASQTVTVRPSPIAGFDYSPLVICEDDIVSFTNTSDLLMSCLGLGIQPCTANSQCSPFPCLNNLTTIQYFFGDGSSSLLTNPNHAWVNPGSYNVTLTVTDIFNGCSNSYSVPINVLASGGSVNVPGPQEICTGESTEITASGGSSYSWTSNPPGFTSTDATITVSPEVTTTYIVSAPGCTGPLTGSVTVTVNPLPDVAVTPESASICLGLSTTLTASGASTYSWSPAAGLSGTTGSTVVASPGGTTTYTVIGTDANGCENTAVAEVEIVEELSAEIAADAPLDYCESKGTEIDVNLDAGAGFDSYMWSTGSTDQIINATAPGDYIVTVEDASGCIAIDTITITLVPDVNALAGDDTDICAGDQVTLNASGGSIYLWSPEEGLSNPNISNPVADPESTTTYEVTVSVGECSDVDEVTVTVLELPVVEAGTDAVILPGESVELSASGGVEYSWSPATGLSDPDISNPVASPEQTTTYTVTVTDDNGCSNVESVTITVDDTECPLTTLFVPNAFSPNGDGQNEVLFVRLQDNFDRMDFRIYNRWGELVFETDNINEGWDGSYEGKVQSGGVFAYYLEIQCGDEIKSEKGNITIVR